MTNGTEQRQMKSVTEMTDVELEMIIDAARKYDPNERHWTERQRDALVELQTRYPKVSS